MTTTLASRPPNARPTTQNQHIRLGLLSLGLVAAVLTSLFAPHVDDDGRVTRAALKSWTRRRQRQRQHANWCVVTERRLTDEELEPLDDASSQMEDSEDGDEGGKRCRTCNRRLPCAADALRARNRRVALALKLALEAAALAVAALNVQGVLLVLLALVQVLLILDVLWMGAESDAAAVEQEKSDAKLTGHKDPGGWDTRIEGVWDKVDELSDSQDAAADLLQLGGLPRNAVKLFKGMQMEAEHGSLRMTAITKMPFLSLSPEIYALDSSVAAYKRRDLRPGK
ncbi:hypothetical protein FOA52_014603 [Chlamydomonas sp. UWO 241]|nr:hypothetical protein FOA52_014603 [Chlamydomonas sp. UWO 241]